jgi:hypothetical protein
MPESFNGQPQEPELDGVLFKKTSRANTVIISPLSFDRLRRRTRFWLGNGLVSGMGGRMSKRVRLRNLLDWFGDADWFFGLAW